MSGHWHGVESASAGPREAGASPTLPARADSPGFFLTTKRLGFRCWSAADESLAIGLWCNRQVTALIGGPWTREVALNRLAREMELHTQFGVQYWPVFLLSDGRHAGCAGLQPYQLSEAVYEMGVHLLPDFWAQGIAREGAEALIPYAFGRLQAAAIFAGHHPQNAASGRLLKALGFAYQGDQLYIPTGLMHPCYLLRREQANARPPSGRLRTP